LKALQLVNEQIGYHQCYHYLAVPKGDSNVPSRRTAKEPLREKVFSYYTKKERQLIEEAAERESRSLSSFVALAAIEHARRIIGRK
jgi:Protein of unknown function (DUF1778)